MEGKEEANAGVTMKENSYTVAPMTENPTLNPSPNLKIVQFSGNELKKKRGRPRKYAADGPVALSPMPISSSIPLTGLKRSRGRSVDTFINSHKVHHHEGPGNISPCVLVPNLKNSVFGFVLLLHCCHVLCVLV